MNQPTIEPRETIASTRQTLARAREKLGQSRRRVQEARRVIAQNRLHQWDGERDLVDQLFLKVVTGTAPFTDQGYFDNTPRILAEAWGSGAFLTEIDPSDESMARLLGIAGMEQEIAQAHELRGMPWLDPTPAGTVYHPAGVGDLFPDDALLAGAEAYLSVPLWDSKGVTTGYVGLIGFETWSPGEAVAAESLLRLVAPRAGAELERRRLQRRLAAEGRNFEMLAEQTRDGFVSWLDGSIPESVTVNRGAEEMTGYSALEIALRPELVIEPVLAAFGDPLAAATAQSSIIVLESKDGRLLELEASLSVSEEAGSRRRHRCVLRSQERSNEGSWPRSVLEMLPFAALVLREADLIFMNDRAVEVLGAGPESVLELPIGLHHGRQHSVSTIGEFARRAPRSRASRTVVKLKPKRGHERFIQMRLRPLTIDGAPALIIAPLDLTDQEEAHERVRGKADLVERILGALPIDMVVINGTGDVVALSDSYSEFLQRARPLATWRPALEIGDNYLDVCRRNIDPGSEETLNALHGIGSVLGRAVPYFMLQYEVANEEGASRSLMMVATPLDGDGAVITHGDVTSLKQGERALAEREARQRDILDNLLDQLVRVSRDGRVLEVRMPGAKSRMVPPFPRAPMGRSVRELLPADASERLMRAIQDAVLSNSANSCLLALPAEGDEREYEMRIVPLPNHDCLVSVNDRAADHWTLAAGHEGGDRGNRARIVRENPYGLTFREVAVLELMADGAADKEIAAKLGVSVFTVYKHVSKILHKMNAPSRTEASLRTVREHLFD